MAEDGTDADSERMPTSIHLERRHWVRLRRMALERQVQSGRRVTMADLVNEAVGEWLNREATDPDRFRAK